MADTGEKFDPKAFLPPVYGYYSTPEGKLLSMPFNSSTPVFYFNKDAFKKAGLDPDEPPKTWPEVAADAKKLLAAGAQCGFTTGWQTWIQLENFSAWHNLPFATEENGFGGLDTKLDFNGPLQVRHIQQLADWQKDKTFIYGGREDKPKTKFSSGECAMHLDSSGAAGGIKQAKFGLRHRHAAVLAGRRRARRRTPSSAAPRCGCCANKPKEHYKGVAKFFTFISSPEIQADWHQSTGYVPITLAAYELTKKQGFYEKNPGRDVAVLRAHQQAADARIPRASASATSCRSATSTTRSWRRSGPARRRRSRRSTRRSSAATSCCASSSRRTSRVPSVSAL